MDVVAMFGAFFFGLIIGWFIYFTNRYRKGDVQFSDITSLLGIIGGAAVTGLFGEAKTSLFGAYGIGLAVGFFGYFYTLYRLVQASNGAYDLTWFIDGRRKKLPNDVEIPGDTRTTTAPMSMQTPLQDRIATLEARLDGLVSRSSEVLQTSPLSQAIGEQDRGRG